PRRHHHQGGAQLRARPVANCKGCHVAIVFIAEGLGRINPALGEEGGMSRVRLGLTSWVTPLCAMALLVVLLAGCGLPLPFPQPVPDPKLPDAQQVFRPLTSGANAGDIDSLDPALIQFGFDYGMAQLIFPQLVTLDKKQQPVDWAAESHE